MDFLLGFFISSSLFSSESCSCFQLDYTSKKYDYLYSSLRGCIFGDLPKLIEYLGGMELYPSHFGIDRQANHQKLMDHYFVDCFTSYSVKGINSLFVELRKDFNAELNWLKKDTLRQIDDLKMGKRPCLWNENGVDQCIPHNYKKLTQIAEAGPIGREAITETENKFYAQIQRDIEFCIGHHQNPFALYNQGAFYFLHGNALQAIQAGIAFIELAHEENEKVDSNVYLQLGEAYSETLAYDKALVSLTQAIKADPENKEAYIERAMAYFELGNFDSSLDDYIVSGMRPKPFMSNTTDLFSFAAGISLGALKGGATATGEFIPSVLSSLQGENVDHVGENSLRKGWNPHCTDETKGLEMERFSMPYALLATQLALLGRITPELRAVEISLAFDENEKLIMTFYFDLEVSDDTLENWSIASMEVSASLCCFSENHFEYLNAFEDIPIQGQLAYLRKPSEDPENINLEFLSREIFNFKEKIGHFVNPIDGHSIETSWGVIHRAVTKSKTIPAIPKTHKINIPLLAFIELSIQKALLGKASSELRAVTLQYDEKNNLCFMHFYFDGDISKNLIGLWEYAVSEITASAWPFCEFNTEITRLDAPQQIPETGTIKYLRHEVALSDGL